MNTPDTTEDTTPPDGTVTDPVIAILSELTAAMEAQIILGTSTARLIALNDWEATKAVREATIAALNAVHAARAAEAAVNVFADQMGKLVATIDILTVNLDLYRREVQRTTGRVSGLEMEVDERIGLRLSKNGDK